MQDCKRGEAKSYAVCYLLVKTSRAKFLQKISKTILKSTFPWNESAPKKDRLKMFFRGRNYNPE